MKQKDEKKKNANQLNSLLLIPKCYDLILLISFNFFWTLFKITNQDIYIYIYKYVYSTLFS